MNSNQKHSLNILKFIAKMGGTILLALILLYLERGTILLNWTLTPWGESTLARRIIGISSYIIGVPYLIIHAILLKKKSKKRKIYTFFSILFIISYIIAYPRNFIEQGKMNLFNNAIYEENCKICEAKIGSGPERCLSGVDIKSMEILDFNYIIDNKNYYINRQKNTGDLNKMTEYINEKEIRHTGKLFQGQKEITIKDYNQIVYYKKLNNFILKLKCSQ